MTFFSNSALTVRAAERTSRADADAESEAADVGLCRRYEMIGDVAQRGR
jgi:hypothetical protein